MGFLTEDIKLKPVPRTPESLAGGEYLTQLLRRSPAIPTQQIAGLTPVEQAIMQYLPQYLASAGTSGDLALGEYSKILTGGYDPLTSPAYEGFRQEAERLKKEGVTSLRQRAQLGGMLESTSAAAQEAGFINQANSQILQALGQLFEAERGRKMQAAQGIQSAEGQKLANVAAIGGIAGTERSIEQMRNDAMYQQLLTQIMFPYQQQAQIASTMMGSKYDTYSTGGGLKDWAEAAQFFSPLISAGISGI